MTEEFRSTRHERHVCSRCGEPGHNLRTCKREEATAEVEPVLQEIAELRQESDALAIEAAEYERVLEHCKVRISDNHRRIAVNQVQIARLRGWR